MAEGLEGLEGDLCLASLSPGGLEPMRRKHCEELPASQASWTSQEGLSKRSRAATGIGCVHQGATGNHPDILPQEDGKETVAGSCSGMLLSHKNESP